MKFLRILLSILILIILIGIIAAALLVIFIDPNKLKPALVSKVKQYTGYQLTIDGNLAWSFYPDLGVKAAHMTLRAPNEPTIFADLRDIRIASTWRQIKEGLRDLKGDIYIGDVRFANLHAERARIGLHWQNQVLTLMPISANLYGGEVKGSAHGRTFAALPAWDWDVQFDRIQLQPLLEDVNGVNSKVKIAGTGFVKLLGAAQGKTREQILGTLQGSSQFTIKNGVVRGADIHYLVKTADALINKQPITAPDGFNRTTFESLTGNAIILNGVAKTNNLSLLSETLDIKGAGDINLVAQTIDLSLLVKTQQTIVTPWQVPVLVTGNLNSPEVRLDMREIEKVVLKKELDRVKTKVKEEIEEHVPGKTGEILQKLLGN